MEDEPSARVIEQRIRNRIMEAALTLAEGNDGVQQCPGEYFEAFYDWIPHHEDGAMPPNSALTEEERQLLADLSRIIDQACDATPREVTAAQLLASGWPEKVRPIAQRALDAMLKRGRFSEEQEEQEPSSREPWP
jgi:hypothetical protein